MMLEMKVKILSARQSAWRYAKLSSKQRVDLVFDAIASFYEEYHYAPTIREIGDITGITSTSVVVYYLQKLEQDGRIERSGEKYTTRNIIITGAVWLSPKDAIAFENYRRKENDKN